jgi:putative ubiquitin-RnfH superfamily antitoxin RatB of RatAB toxin-antitoxin module
MHFVKEHQKFMAINLIKVEVAYATAEKQQIVSVQVSDDSTIEKIILASGILALFPEIDLIKQKVGVFSKSKKLTDIAQDGDRIEIYRGLLIDPKEGRRKRALDNKS